MKKILASLLCSFLAIVAVGCGGSSNDIGAQVSGQQVPATRSVGSIGVVLSAEDLGDMFPSLAINAQGAAPGAITRFYVFAYDAVGTEVARASTEYLPGSSLNLLLQGLQLLNFDVVLAGVDQAGNVVGAQRAEDIAPVPNGVREVGRAVFYPIEGFVLPTDITPPTPTENIDVSVSFSGNVPQVSFTGGNAFSVTAVPEDLIEDFQAGRVTPLDDEYSRVYTRVSTNGTNAVSSPALLNSSVISGTVTNFEFEGFEAGVEYQISVVRMNGDFGFVNHELVP